MSETIITLGTSDVFCPRYQAWQAVQELLSRPFGGVRAAMGQGGLRGHEGITKMGAKVFRSTMLTILGHKYSGPVDFEFADSALQRIILHRKDI